MNDISMTVEEREAFLAETRVGVVSIERASGPSLTVPIWYDYEPGGDVWMLMGGSTLKARLIRSAGRLSLCVQDDTSPYRYVSVEGTTTIREMESLDVLRAMAVRYLGQEGGDFYTDNIPHNPDEIVVTMTPNRWFTTDYSKANRPTPED